MAERAISCDYDGCTIAEFGVCGRTGEQTPCEHATLGEALDEQGAAQVEVEVAASGSESSQETNEFPREPDEIGRAHV